MNERRMRFWIGLFVLASLVLLGALFVLFGSLPTVFRNTNPYTILFTDAPGVNAGTPVRLSGVRIGAVRDLALDDETSQVSVRVEIDRQYTIHRNEQPTLITSLLGSDASIDFIPQVVEGQAPDRSPVPPGALLLGVRAASVNTLLNRASEVVPTTQETLNDMRKSLQRLERMAPLMEETLREYRDLGRAARETIPDLRRTNDEVRELARSARQAIPEFRRTNDDIGATARTWGRLGERLDVLVQTNQDKVIKAIDNASKAIDSLNDVLDRAASLLSDENQRNVSATLKNLDGTDRLESMAQSADDILKEGRVTVRRLNDTLLRANEVLTDLQKVTKPLGERGGNTMRSLDESLDKTNRILTDLRALLQVVGQSDGTLNRILTDPALYNHLDETACQVLRLVPRLDRILKDFETFADKLARHPEALGAGGIIRPGSGLKDPPTPPHTPRFQPLPH